MKKFPTNTKRQRRNRKADPCLRQAGLTAIYANVCAAYRVPARNWVPFGCAQGRRDDT